MFFKQSVCVDYCGYCKRYWVMDKLGQNNNEGKRVPGIKTLTSGGKDQRHIHAHSWKGNGEVPNAIRELLRVIRVQSPEFG